MDTFEMLSRATVLGAGFAGVALGGVVGGALGTLGANAIANLADDFLLSSCQRLQESRLHYSHGPVNDHIRMLSVRAARDATNRELLAYCRAAFPDAADRSDKRYAALQRLRRALHKQYQDLEKAARKSRRVLDQMGFEEQHMREILASRDEATGIPLKDAPEPADPLADSALRRIAEAIHAEPEIRGDLLAFLSKDDRLAHSIHKIFIEWLKTDEPLANMAWRAFQLWFNQQVLDKLDRIAASEDDLSQDLREVRTQLQEISRSLGDLSKEARRTRAELLVLIQELSRHEDERYGPGLLLADHEPAGGEMTLPALRYDRRWLPWQDYPEARDIRRSLEDFVDNTRDSFLWTVLTGMGGVGKSRLAFELCHSFAAEGWRTGFLNEKGWLGSDSPRDWRTHQDTLIVIDYAANTVTPFGTASSRFATPPKTLPAVFACCSSNALIRWPSRSAGAMASSSTVCASACTGALPPVPVTTTLPGPRSRNSGTTGWHRTKLLPWAARRMTMRYGKRSPAVSSIWEPPASLCRRSPSSAV